MERWLFPALAGYLLLINLIAFFAYGRDKRLAREGRFRTPEARLLTYAALGGALGSLLGMRRFRHKTKKRRFRLLVPVFLTLHLVLAALYAAYRLGLLARLIFWTFLPNFV